MSDSIHIVCPHCQSINRVPANKLAEKLNCGRCQHPLFTGEPIELTTATVEDITDLKRVEQALNAMRRQREELASHVPGLLYQYRLRPNGSSHFPYASARIQEYTGLHRRMLLKMPLLRSRRSILKTATVCMKPYGRRGSHLRFGMTSTGCSFQTVG